MHSTLKYKLGMLCAIVIFAMAPARALLSDTAPHITACSGKSVGSACNFTGAQGQSISGTCELGPANDVVCGSGLEPSANNHFSDTAGHTYQTAIEYIADQGIINGYDDGTFRPNAEINRAELLKIILEADNVSVADNLTYCFPDVRSDWYAPYVCQAKNMEIVSGYSDGYFRPGNAISFVEAAKIITIAFAYLQPTYDSVWYKPYVESLEGFKAIPTSIDDFSQELTRGEVAEIIYRLVANIQNKSSASYAELADDDADEVARPSSSTTVSSIIDTNQRQCFDNSSEISCPSGGSFFGQDGNYTGIQPSYTDNGDGTITDNNTGLMWLQDAGEKVEYYPAIDAADSFEFAGYADWRVPTIKELYTVVDFSGEDVPNIDGTDSTGLIPFIDTYYFAFEYGDTSTGARIIDSQWITNTIYTASVMVGEECFFGFNFADGRIKCYPTSNNRSGGYFMRYVRGDLYGVNNFNNNGNGTVKDESTSLMWQQSDSGEGMDWEDALAYCEALSLAGYSDWRLPNAKELQYIVDYSRSPDATDSAAIDPVFDTTSITNEAGEKDYPYFWTGTTHKSPRPGQGVYIAFGRCLGDMGNGIIDVHGAGCQRSGSKSEVDESTFQESAPQGDINRVENYVRCVRE